MTKVNSMGKRLGAAVMACAMAMAMAVSAGAVSADDIPANGVATIYQDGSTDISHSNMLLANEGEFTMEVSGSVVEVSISTQPLEREMGGVVYTGYIGEGTEFSVNGVAVDSEITQPSESADGEMVLFIPLSAFGDSNGELVDSILVDVDFEVVTSSQDGSFNHTTNSAADIVLEF